MSNRPPARTPRQQVYFHLDDLLNGLWKEREDMFDLSLLHTCLWKFTYLIEEILQQSVIFQLICKKNFWTDPSNINHLEDLLSKNEMPMWIVMLVEEIIMRRKEESKKPNHQIINKSSNIRLHRPNHEPIHQSDIRSQEIVNSQVVTFISPPPVTINRSLKPEPGEVMIETPRPPVPLKRNSNRRNRKRAYNRFDTTTTTNSSMATISSSTKQLCSSRSISDSSFLNDLEEDDYYNENHISNGRSEQKKMRNNDIDFLFDKTSINPIHQLEILENSSLNLVSLLNFFNLKNGRVEIYRSNENFDSNIESQFCLPSMPPSNYLYTCNICTLKRKLSLNSEKDDSNPNFFSYRADALLHRLEMHDDMTDMNKRICPICFHGISPYYPFSRYKFREHLFRHFGEPAYVCQQCLTKSSKSYRFNTLISFIHHLQLFHENDMQPQLSDVRDHLKCEDELTRNLLQQLLDRYNQNVYQCKDLKRFPLTNDYYYEEISVCSHYSFTKADILLHRYLSHNDTTGLKDHRIKVDLDQIFLINLKSTDIEIKEENIYSYDFIHYIFLQPNNKLEIIRDNILQYITKESCYSCTICSHTSFTSRQYVHHFLTTHPKNLPFSMKQFNFYNLTQLQKSHHLIFDTNDLWKFIFHHMQFSIEHENDSTTANESLEDNEEKKIFFEKNFVKFFFLFKTKKLSISVKPTFKQLKQMYKSKRSDNWKQFHRNISISIRTKQKSIQSQTFSKKFRKNLNNSKKNLDKRNWKKTIKKKSKSNSHIEKRKLDINKNSNETFGDKIMNCNKDKKDKNTISTTITEPLKEKPVFKTVRNDTKKSKEFGLKIIKIDKKSEEISLKNNKSDVEEGVKICQNRKKKLENVVSSTNIENKNPIEKKIDDTTLSPLFTYRPKATTMEMKKSNENCKDNLQITTLVFQPSKVNSMKF
ncbi:hypothetical protein SNEBB_011429 [Seison nebaliae]|nr:hypothetical protein SNEBB_011429 [Seison nebaliae]